MSGTDNDIILGSDRDINMVATKADIINDNDSDQLSRPREENHQAEGDNVCCIVKWFNPEKQFGFLIVMEEGSHQGDEVFCHAHDCIDPIRDGDKVFATIGADDKDSRKKRCMDVRGGTGEKGDMKRPINANEILEKAKEVLAGKAEFEDIPAPGEQIDYAARRQRDFGNRNTYTGPGGVGPKGHYPRPPRKFAIENDNDRRRGGYHRDDRSYSNNRRDDHRSRRRNYSSRDRNDVRSRRDNRDDRRSDKRGGGRGDHRRSLRDDSRSRRRDRNRSSRGRRDSRQNNRNKHRNDRNGSNDSRGDRNDRKGNNTTKADRHSHRKDDNIDNNNDRKHSADRKSEKEENSGLTSSKFNLADAVGNNFPRNNSSSHNDNQSNNTTGDNPFKESHDNRTSVRNDNGGRKSKRDRSVSQDSSQSDDHHRQSGRDNHKTHAPTRGKKRKNSRKEHSDDEDSESEISDRKNKKRRR